jgi:hypothetical protein
MPRRLRSFWIHAPLAALVLMAPALANGFPFLFFDTVQYDEFGRSILSHAAGMLQGGGAAAGASGAAAATAADGGTLSYVGGRSPVYSLFVSVGEAAGSYWLVAAVQCLIGAWLVGAAARAAAPARPLAAFWTAIGLLAAASPLPFYAAFVMPDVHCGYGLAAVALLGLAPRTFRPLERVALALAAAFAFAAHTTNLALGIVALAILGLGAWRARLGLLEAARRGAWVAAPVVLALAAGGLFTLATTLALGEPARSPPYLMARILADGPGRAYLATACEPRHAFEICRFRDRRLDYHNDILWSRDPARGVFLFADTPSRRRMAVEETRFVLAVIRHDPWGEAAAAARNTGRQLAATGVADEFSKTREIWDQMWFARLSPGATAAATGSLAYRGRFPFGLFDLAQRTGLGLALAYLAWRLVHPATRRALRRAPADRTPDEDRLAGLVLVTLGLMALLLANAALCGALSGVQNRYQVRLLWLPLLLSALWAYSAPRPGGIRSPGTGDTL